MALSNGIHVTDGQYTRAQVLGLWGKRNHVPTQCGAPVRSKHDTPCPCTPTWYQQGRWTCGKHRANRDPHTLFECPICYEPCARAADAYTTPCKHRFHHACMNRWAASTVTSGLYCPLCRHVLNDRPFPIHDAPPPRSATFYFDQILARLQQVIETLEPTTPL